MGSHVAFDGNRRLCLSWSARRLQGLYGGLGHKDIHARKGLKKRRKILDPMKRTEHAANLFRATQTER